MAKLFWREQIQKKDIDTLKRHLRAKLDGYRVRTKYARTDNLLFRGVVCDEPPSVIDRISYPPAEKVVKLGRLNRIGQAMFYSSRGAPAVLYEIDARQGQRIAMSTWELIEPLWMHNLGFHQDSLERIGAPVIGPRVELAEPIPNETKYAAKLRRQLSHAFSEQAEEGQEYRYKLSIAINELLFDEAGPLATNMPNGPRCDRAVGTVYPAMQMRGVVDNVVMLPEFVDRYLRLKFVNYVLVEAADVQKSSFTVSSLATSDEFSGKEIIWKPGIIDERRRHGHIAFENGLWVLRDGFNQIFEIH